MSEPSRYLYRHYKGGLYRHIALAHIEATGEPVVVYQSAADASVWVRPREEFYGLVNSEGHRIKRFQLVEEPAS